MIGDVSSHGYRAALIMALAMSASAIHAQVTSDPGEVLGALLRSLREELTSTEMFISVFYCVVDRKAGELRYANAGHPHAFVVDGSGGVHRLSAGAPPLGMVDDPPPTVVRSWQAGCDLLLLFTDGVSDARNRLDQRLGEQPILDVAMAEHDQPPREILQRLYERLQAHAGDLPPRDDLTLVLVRS
jgi:sigma-B regulation protein RsbU (phosphoserine phosphatase)